jgi:hypothetical protein
MNTLSRTITSHILENEDAYAAVRSHWSGLVNSSRKHELSPAHHLLYLALCGKDWRKGFTPIANHRKLANGAFYNWGLWWALRALHSREHEAWLLAPFGGLVTPDMLEKVRKLVLQPGGLFAFSPAAYIPRAYPFDAYLEAALSAPDAAPEGMARA